MLCLKGKTNRGWIKAAKSDLNSILIDHAHCEKKAAATGMSLLSYYTNCHDICIAMSELVAEEMEHYRSVIQIMTEMGIKMTQGKADDYVHQLLQHVRKNEPEKMLDRLLTAGLIEARSCERLKILGENLDDPMLSKFYIDLSVSEAGHYMTFVKLAQNYFPEDVVKNRLNELSEIEQKIIKTLPNVPLIHG